MEKATDFITYAVARAKPTSIPTGAIINFQVGLIQPWEYLFGTTGIKCTQSVLDNRYKRYYSTHGWTREEYDKITKGWVERGVYVCDCEGLLDSFLHTDVTADYCYNSWCTEKGKISEISRPWVIGEAVFNYSASSNKMTHVGWVCGFMPDGDPVVVEERGIRYGCVITQLSKRQWTYRGLVTKKLSYSEEPMAKPIFDRVTDPMQKGDVYKTCQHLINQCGFTDNQGKAISEDGVYGNKSLQAFNKFMNYYGKTPKTDDVKIYVNDVLTEQFKVLEE